MKSKTIWMSELSLGSGNFIIRTNVGETIGPAMHPRSERKFHSLCRGDFEAFPVDFMISATYF